MYTAERDPLLLCSSDHHSVQVSPTASNRFSEADGRPASVWRHVGVARGMPHQHHGPLLQRRYFTPNPRGHAVRHGACSCRYRSIALRQAPPSPPASSSPVPHSASDPHFFRASRPNRKRTALGSDSPSIFPSQSSSRMDLTCLCTFPLTSDLFAQAVHPSEPVIAVGLSSGHVSALKLPSEGSSDEPAGPPGRRGSDGRDVIQNAWRTRRHHGSCRALAYSIDGAQLYSGGTDGILKAADSETGRVVGKIAVPLAPSSKTDEVDAPTVIHALSPQTLLLATDSGALHLYDLRDPAPTLPLESTKTAFITGRPSQTHHPHTDYISSVSPLPPSSTSTSGYSKQWLSTGGTTVALTDLRRGVLVKSEDQEEILLSSLYVTGLPAKKSSGSSGEKAVIGGADGVITLWEKGQWDDQEQRITVSREKETLDVLAEVPEGVGGIGKKVAVGLGDGTIRLVRLGMNKVIGELRHDEIEGVVGLGFEVGGRMISGGGPAVKVWTEAMAQEDAEDEEAVVGKRAAGSDDSDAEDDGDSSEEEEKTRKRRKKRKRGKGPAAASGFSFAGLD